MSEIPPFTDKPPVNLEDTELQIGMKKMREQLLGVMALEEMDQSIANNNGGVIVFSGKAGSITVNGSHEVNLYDSNLNEHYIDLNDALDALGDLDTKPQLEHRSSVRDNPEFLGFLATMLSVPPSVMYDMVVARKKAEGHPGLAYI